MQQAVPYKISSRLYTSITDMPQVKETHKLPTQICEITAGDEMWNDNTKNYQTPLQYAYKSTSSA